ncbi:MAG: hypothetical protein ACP5IE_10490, partial [Infirmifilum sp.]
MNSPNLANLMPNDDDFVSIYQELVKHEICLMRVGDLCEYNNGYYTSRSGFPLRHDVNFGMSILDILYVILVKASNIVSKYRPTPSDVDNFVDRLKRSRLLVDIPCSALSHDPTKYVMSVINSDSELILTRLENPFMYYHMYFEILRNLSNYGIDINNINDLIRKYLDFG